MSKELNAREWIETNEVANLDLPDSVHEMDIEGKVKELCIAFGESYATARLEAYKAEVRKAIEELEGTALTSVSHVAAANYQHREREAKQAIRKKGR